jgi:hypothetical protein
VGALVGGFVSLIGTGTVGLMGARVGARVLGLTGPAVLGTGFGFIVGARVLGFTGAVVTGAGFGFMVGARVLESGRAQEHPSVGPRHNVSTHTCVLLLQRQTHLPPFAAHPFLVGVPCALVVFVTSSQISGGSPMRGSV